MPLPVIPAIALKLLPYGAAALALVGAVWYIDHGGYNRAEKEATQREQAQKYERQVFANLMAINAKGVEGSMQKSIDDSDLRVINSLDRLQLINRTVIQPTLTKEIQRETRFTNSAAGISDIMWQELNRARSFSEQRPCPTGSNAVACFSMPSTEPTGEQDPGNPSN